MRDKGAHFISAMVEDYLRKPATRTTADQWIAKYHCEYDLVVDSKTSIAPEGETIGMPYNVVVDPRTMKIEKIVPGDGAPVDSVVEALIARNTK